ncbi:TPA: hypothetical protein ACRI62_002842 [Klebsiella michiganensis]
MLTGIERTAKISEVSRRCRSLLPNLSIRKIINAVYFSTTGAGAPASGCFFCVEHEAKKVAPGRPLLHLYQIPANLPNNNNCMEIQNMEYESKTPQDVLVYTDSPIFHKRTVILDLAADVTCGDVINPTTGAAYVAADADNCAVALQNQIAGDARSLVISDTQCVFNPAGLVVATAAKDAAYAALIKQGNRIADANTAI